MNKKIVVAILISLSLGVASYADTLHKVLIQVSTDNPKLRAIALNNAVNL